MPKPKISIVVGFRNRELNRVKRSLDSLSRQSFKDFEVHFIDYGSDQEVAFNGRQLVTAYSFCSYYYSDAKGWFWNRSDALNTGINKARGDVLVVFDIDLIVEDDFLEKISALNYDEQFYTFSCFYLPENFTFENSDLLKDGIHHEQNYVGLCAVKREYAIGVGGFDEYFMVWGAEDDDLYQKFGCNGLQRMQMEASKYHVFHQWHAKESPEKPGLWYLTMVNYLYSPDRKNFKEEIALNKERPVLKLLGGRSYMQTTRFEFLTDQKFLFFNSFIQKFMDLSAGETAYLEYQLPEQKKGGMKKLFTKRLVKREKIDLNDINSFLQYFVGVNRQYLSDYYLKSDGGNILFVCIKR